jgi:hypothetical protein
MAFPIPGGFADTKESNYDPLPVGTYDALVVAVEHRDVKPETAERWATDPKKGDPEEAQALDGQHPGLLSWEFDITWPEEYNNRKSWNQTPLTRKAKGILLGTLLAVGYDRSELDQEDFSIDVEGRCIGAAVQLVVDVDKNAVNVPGQPVKTRVKKVLPPKDQTDEVLP